MLCYAVSQAGYGTNSSGDSGCLLCQSGSFWPGSAPEYDDYGGEYGPYDQEADAGLFFPASTQLAAAEPHSMQAHLQGGQRRFGAQLGVQPCINCSHILPSGRSTTLGVGSTSAKQCICTPGEPCAVHDRAGHRHTQRWHYPAQHSFYARRLSATQPASSTHMWGHARCSATHCSYHTTALQANWRVSVHA